MLRIYGRLFAMALVVCLAGCNRNELAAAEYGSVAAGLLMAFIWKSWLFVLAAFTGPAVRLALARSNLEEQPRRLIALGAYVAATALLLFVVRPWHIGTAGPIAATYGADGAAALVPANLSASLQFVGPYQFATSEVGKTLALIMLASDNPASSNQNQNAVANCHSALFKVQILANPFQKAQLITSDQLTLGFQNFLSLVNGSRSNSIQWRWLVNTGKDAVSGNFVVRVERQVQLGCASVPALDVSLPVSISPALINPNDVPASVGFLGLLMGILANLTTLTDKVGNLFAKSKPAEAS